MKSLLHSCPSWALGLRAAHAKFGGNVIIGGIGPVEDRIRAIAHEFSEDLTSFHLLHELRTECGAYKPYNSPYAISWDGLLSGVRKGSFPRVAAITAPAFGLPGIEGGAILSEDLTIRQMAYDLHKEAIEKSMYLKGETWGEGVVIWWPAWDSERENRGQVRKSPLSRVEAWKRLRDFWIVLLDRTGGVVHLEWKPKVPGRDYVNSIHRAIRFCQEVNRALRREAMVINS